MVDWVKMNPFSSFTMPETPREQHDTPAAQSPPGVQDQQQKSREKLEAVSHPHCDVSCDTEEGQVVITLNHENFCKNWDDVDVYSSELMSAFREVEKTNAAREVVIDLSGFQAIGSAGLSCMLRFHKELYQSNTDSTIVIRCDTRIQEIMSITTLDTLWEVKVVKSTNEE